MVREVVLGVVLSIAVIEAQPRVPAFLDAAPLQPRLQTPHLQAQARGPVRIGPDGRASVTVTVTPRPKMHIYAADVEGYVPFTLKVEPLAGVSPGKVTYPDPETYVFPPTGETSRVYIRPFEVTQSITLASDGRASRGAGERVPGVVTLRYQACDDTVCYRPTTGRFVFDLIK